MRLTYKEWFVFILLFDDYHHHLYDDDDIFGTALSDPILVYQMGLQKKYTGPDTDKCSILMTRVCCGLIVELQRVVMVVYCCVR